ncbi:ABC transporter ATP-binding protein [Eubacterium xylanophilum]|uniref:ABC transporter ATP-binding protein n=1 Tax=Eubacterium xylanophilum TaxID=39497 RepID=UPI00047A06E7|nr:ATP-binding cassette domain-containing protein [Eubacterium xylanophilum]
MIEVKNLVKRYGDRNVVDDLSFTVDKGQVVGFLGPNGAGKSTTMNIITGYISATEGEVKVNGYDVFEDPEKAKACIGYLPEQPPVYPDMKVREYLAFVAELKKVDREDREKQILDVVRATKIQDVSERLIKHLSKGYRQRVGLAGAMIGNPDILILDEPTVGLDPKQIIEIRNLIKELSKEHTILISSHIMQEVNAVCNQILIINQGKLILSDTPENIPEHISQTNEIVFRAKGEKNLVKSLVEKLDDVIDFKIKRTEEQEVIQVELSSPANKDVREDIFFTFAEAKCPIIEMNLNVPTLEEVFLRLTGEGTRQYGGKISKDERKKMKRKLIQQKRDKEEKSEEEAK